ncbi:MAG TPA: prolyl oligopeptidase family serine peptidase [Caulifigura sp.]|nr:prolyl oligopeptidase family serine peptidase [Caulifigura sp.]
MFVLKPLANVRTIRTAACFLAALCVVSPFAAGQAPSPPPPAPLTEAEQEEARATLAGLNARLAELRKNPQVSSDLWADADVFVKAATWGLDFGPINDDKSRTLLKNTLRRAADRIEALEGGKPVWDKQHGRVARAFVSTVDGSTQPFGLVIPANYDASKPFRLDVVLHGSMRPTGISEMQFLSQYNATDDKTARGASQDWIELHPLGRLGENAYRFEGETDVDEAIACVLRHYNIDRSRTVLRGSSLGGVGAWAIGLKRPDRWAAVGPACGPVDTYVFAASPRSNFKPLDPVTPWHKLTLHMVDAIDYTANARMVPVVPLMGELDEYMSSHRLIEAEFKKEGIPFDGVIEFGAGHALTKKGFTEQFAILNKALEQAAPDRGKRVHFTTWTLKYNRCFWVELLGLGRHYERALIQASLADDGSVTMEEPQNITRLALYPPALAGKDSKLTIGGKVIPLGTRRGSEGSPIVLARENGAWHVVDGSPSQTTGKRPGLQGPIDDAFATKFLCVRGTGTPLNPAIGAWADANLARFTDEWRRHYRGNLPVKNDRDVTDEDLRTSNLILFGDPGSNSWIAKALPAMPFQWSKETLQLRSHRPSAADHALSAIAPSPFPGAAGKYVVFNSGHTYHGDALRLSYMVYPRLGDWAVMKIGPNNNAKTAAVDETVVQSGFFDEDWRGVIEPKE